MSPSSSPDPLRGSPIPPRSFAERFLEQISKRAGVQNAGPKRLAGWLTDVGLAPLTAHYLRNKPEHQALSDHLQPAYHHTSGLTLIQQELFERFLEAAAPLQIEPVVFKGAALAVAVYPHPATRPMGDIDIWLPHAQIRSVIDRLERSGFRWIQKAGGPGRLKTGRSGEFQLVYPRWQNILLEIHATPFPGWWLDQTTPLPDHLNSIRQRTHPLPGRDPLKQLEKTDAVIQLATHLAVNHQFGLYPLRSLVDICLMLESQPPDWDTLVSRSSQWRLKPVLWKVLTLARAVWKTPIPADVERALAPSFLQRQLLDGIVTPQAIWREPALSFARWRYPILLSLVEQSRDRRRLVKTAVWPSRSDLPGENNSRLHRLWRLITAREL